MVFQSFKKGRAVKNKEIGNGSVTTSATYGRIILSDNAVKLLQLTEGDKIKIVYTDDIKDFNHKFVIFKANNDDDALVLKFQFSKKNIRNGAVVFNTVAWINLLEITNVHAIYENYNEGVLAGLIKLAKKVKLFTPNYLVRWFIGDKVKVDISDKLKIDGYWLTTPKT
ncbi:MAG: hypothetical protein LBG80_04350, partial [Bacteroidales bacterium]|nr:hypothetical protein [Bacteroidales bacterium]